MNIKEFIFIFYFLFLRENILCVNQINEKVINSALETKSSSSNKNSSDVLFSYKDEIDFLFPIRNFSGVKDLPANSPQKKLSLTMSKKLLEGNNVTVEQVQRGWIEIDRKGEEFLIIEGEKYPLEIKSNIIMILDSENSNNSISINLDHYNEQTLKNIQDDPTLVPIEPLQVNWTSPERCKMESMSIKITGHYFNLKINNITIKRSVRIRSMGLMPSWEEGLILSVINPSTCQTTLHFVANTSDISGFRDMNWALDSISNGRLVLVASLRDGAAYLGNRTRQKFSEGGSEYAPFYFFRDSWVNVFIKGGKTLQESFAPNLGQLKNVGSPLFLQFNFDNQNFGNLYDCPSWPSTERWKARKIFCEIHDGFSSLCDCENPLVFHQQNINSPEINGSNSFIPIIIMAGNRTRHFFHLLETLKVQPTIKREAILVVTDGHVENINRLTFILDLKMLVHRPEGKGVMHISRNLRFALFNALLDFPRATAFIVLEDDLVVSPDFYSYMTQLEPIFKIDKSIFCVNAFNHFAYPHTSRDPALTYRVSTFPAYGWMMSRNILEEILPKWMPITFVIEWDYFLGSELVRKERECIIPDINRSYHWASGGIHFSSYFSETLYLSRTLNKLANVTLRPIERLKSEKYEEEMKTLLNASKAIEFRSKKSFDSQISKANNVYAIYVWRTTDSDESSFRFFAFEMKIWIYDARDNHKSAWRISYKNSTILVVGVPQSPYSIYMPQGYKVLKISNETTKGQIFTYGEFIFRRSHKLYTHINHTSLPQ